MPYHTASIAVIHIYIYSGLNGLPIIERRGRQPGLLTVVQSEASKDHLNLDTTPTDCTGRENKEGSRQLRENDR